MDGEICYNQTPTRIRIFVNLLENQLKRNPLKLVPELNFLTFVIAHSSELEQASSWKNRKTQSQSVDTHEF